MVRSHKRQAVIGLLVSLGIITGNLVFPGLNVAPAFAEAKFKDVNDHWAQACIDELAEKKIISGYYEDGTFRPDRPVSRAEFAAMVRTENGSIIVLHDGYCGGEDVAASADKIIPLLLYKGYKFVTVDRLWQQVSA